jgi:S-DNA-T family DNA segregation ATPase FtsK/SpoIIIE
MGPHGILVGATGSGKSELLRSLVTGLAARHDPRLVNFVLVDFKGGAAFADLADLPHSVGLITNLADELTLVDRMQAALRGNSTDASSCSAMPGTSTRSATTTPPRPRPASPPTCPTCRTCW